jgi:hypothetical protein
MQHYRIAERQQNNDVRQSVTFSLSEVFIWEHRVQLKPVLINSNITSTEPDDGANFGARRLLIGHVFRLTEIVPGIAKGGRDRAQCYVRAQRKPLGPPEHVGLEHVNNPTPSKVPHSLSRLAQSRHSPTSQ